MTPLSPAAFLCHPLLAARGLSHGFGTRGAVPPRGWIHPEQVHGRRVMALTAPPRSEVDATCRADAIVSAVPGLAVGVVTADCVPILAAHRVGVVAAIHAGWRGLAQGVIGAALDALGEIAAEYGDSAETDGDVVAVVGPHIGPRHYEVDAPVRDALREHFGSDLDSRLLASRPAHWLLDLGGLAHRALQRAGLASQHIGHLPASCTFADAVRFHSRRRDGAGAGRLAHFIALPTLSPGTGA